VIDGSTLAAHHAGTRHAISDTLASNAITPKQVIGSNREIPY
jgi:hypothetical protein